MKKTELKLIHYNLNLDYSVYNQNIECQTNNLINFIINNFIKFYKDDFANKYIALEYQNDSYSLLAYNILKRIQSIFPFSLIICGKKRKLKTLLKKEDKKEKFVSFRTINKLENINKLIFVSCKHPIYQVLKEKKDFKVFNNTYYILKSFTPNEIETSFSFYNIKTEKKLSRAHTILQAICDGQITMFEQQEFNHLATISKEIPISVIKMTNNIEKDNELVNEVVDKNTIVFYYCEKPFTSYDILQSEYQYFIKYKSNIPNLNYHNINTYEIVTELHQEGYKIVFIGDFSNEEKEKWLQYNLTFSKSYDII